jgi:hypothetical protein
MNTFKHPLISILLVIILSSCNLPSSTGSPTQTTIQNLAGTAIAMTQLANPTQVAIITPTFAPQTANASSTMSTPRPPNTPVWLAYNYTCELADSGGTMTMNLAWIDHSNSEEGYKVYRDEQIIATLEPNSTSYVDVAFVATGKTLSYRVEAFNTAWQVSTSTITYGCVKSKK